MGRLFVVRFMRYNNAYPAQAYLSGLDAAAKGKIEPRFQALAQTFANDGRLPTSSHGHWLEDPYAEIYEFKPGGHRLFAFKHSRNIYVTNGAPKRGRKAQENDYIVAMNLRRDYFAKLRANK